MPPHPAPAYSREPSPADVIERIDLWRQESKTAHAELKGEMRGRFDGIDREIRGLRESLERATGRIAVLEEAPEPRQPARGATNPSTDPGSGLPFKAGWPFTLGAAAVAVSLLGGLQKAVETIGGFFVNLGHMFNPPPTP
jgi:hypothetical protein